MKLITFLLVSTFYLAGVQSAAINSDGYNYDRPAPVYEEERAGDRSHTVESVAGRIDVESSNTQEQSIDESAAGAAEIAVVEETEPQAYDNQQQAASEDTYENDSTVAQEAVQEVAADYSQNEGEAQGSADEVAVIAQVEENNQNEGEVQASADEVAVVAQEEVQEAVADNNQIEGEAQGSADGVAVVVQEEVQEAAADNNQIEGEVQASADEAAVVAQEEVQQIEGESQGSADEVAVVAENADETASEQSIDIDQRVADENLSAQQSTFEGYNYNVPLPGQVDIEAAFAHQELGSEHESHRHGSVKRLRLKTLKAAPNCGGRDWRQVVFDRMQVRPKDRRLSPYTEQIAEQSYFLQ